MTEPFFISYSSVDGLQWATRLAIALARPPNPTDVWLDKQSLRPGEDWDDQIAEAIRLTPALLFVVTEDSVRPYSVCKSEWAFALSHTTPVIPLRFDPHADLPFRLGSREYIDFANSFSSGLERLRAHLSWIDTPEGRRREIHHQLEDTERRLARAAGSDRGAIQQRLAALRAELDAVSPPRAAVADATVSASGFAPSPPSQLDRSSDAGLPVSPIGRARHPPWTPPADRLDPIAILKEQAKGWESELAPVAFGRMLTSLFSFHRGTPAVMAADLALIPSSGIVVQACGNAALTSFGFVANAPTQLVFDILWFDHTLPAPFEWDVKRLATSVVLAAYNHGFSRDTATRVAAYAVKAYRKSMAQFAKLSPFEVLQQPIDATDGALPRGMPKEPERRVAWLARQFGEPGRYVTRNSRGEPRLVAEPPLIRHVDEPAFTSEVRDAYEGYLRSLPDQVNRFLQRYELVDQARRVVGVEQAARPDVLMLLVRREDGEQLLLKLIRPGSSVLEPYVDANPYTTEAERVVRGQRLLQAATDTYLGWTATRDGGSRYVTRLRQMLPMELDRPGKRGKFLANYGRSCAVALARAHARSGDAVTIADYLGHGPAFDDAIAMFARSYAEQTRSDYDAFASAVRAGHLVA